MSRVLAGPLAGMMLGDMGADVIKVERPGSGDESRGWGPPFAPNGLSAYFLCCNRNKLSIALDFDSQGDRAVLEQLIAQADVVIENFRPDALAARGLSAETLLGRHDGLIWCSISGFGPTSARPGYDFVVQAECGWMSVTGEPDGQPMKSGMALADVVAGKDATIAILAALWARARATTALPVHARRLHIALTRSSTAALINVAQNVLVSGAEAGRWGNAHPNLVPYQLFACADRGLVIAVGNDGQWKAACRALGLESLLRDGALETNAGRLAHRSRVVDAIAVRLRSADASHWLGRLQAAGVPCGIVRSVRDAVADAGGDPRTGVPPAIPGSIRLHPPRLDEHGQRIRRLGWSSFRSLGT
jgi:crotonobetainyl-CoA:carnitine CoA-transferase CaiB-like acyl-CoA transferase